VGGIPILSEFTAIVFIPAIRDEALLEFVTKFASFRNWGNPETDLFLK